METQQNK